MPVYFTPSIAVIASWRQLTDITSQFQRLASLRTAILLLVFWLFISLLYCTASDTRLSSSTTTHFCRVLPFFLHT